MFKNKLMVADKDFQLVIPTHQRVDRQVTFMGIPEELRSKVLLITSTLEDARALKRKYKHDLVYAIDDPTVDGIAKKRQWIIENVKSDNIFQMDDDMYFFRRCNKKFRAFDPKKVQWDVLPEYKKKGVLFLFKDGFTNEQKTRRFDFIRDAMLEREYRHTCIASRQNNNRQRKETMEAGRAMHAMGHHRRTLLDNDIRFDEIKFREDFNVTLHLLKRGIPNLIMNNFVVNPLSYGAKGGAFEERTITRSDIAAVKLAKAHAPFVKVVDRKYKESISRKEVIIYWQKCFAASQK